MHHEVHGVRTPSLSRPMQQNPQLRVYVTLRCGLCCLAREKDGVRTQCCAGACAMSATSWPGLDAKQKRQMVTTGRAALAALVGGRVCNVCHVCLRQLSHAGGLLQTCSGSAGPRPARKREAAGCEGNSDGRTACLGLSRSPLHRWPRISLKQPLVLWLWFVKHERTGFA